MMNAGISSVHRGSSRPLGMLLGWKMLVCYVVQLIKRAALAFFVVPAILPAERLSFGFATVAVPPVPLALSSYCYWNQELLVGPIDGWFLQWFDDQDC